jgi:hypothetical protein
MTARSLPSPSPVGDYGEAEDHGVLDRPTLIKLHADELANMPSSSATNHDKLAYLRACNGDSNEATERFLATQAWRSKTGISNLLRNDEWLAMEKEMRSILWYDYLGPDQHGRPVLVERVGRWEVTKVLGSIRADYDDSKDSTESAEENEKGETFLKIHCMSCEIMLQMNRDKQGSGDQQEASGIKDNRGQIVIMDLANLRPWHLDPRLAVAFGRLAKIDSLHYPDTLAHIWVVNAPYLFKALSKLIQPFLDPDTIGKFHVSSGVPKELIACVGKECLPVELGGDRVGIFPYEEGAQISAHPLQG